MEEMEGQEMLKNLYSNTGKSYACSSSSKCFLRSPTNISKWTIYNYIVKLLEVYYGICDMSGNKKKKLVFCSVIAI